MWSDFTYWLDDNRKLAVIVALVIIGAGIFFVGPMVTGSNEPQGVSFTGPSGGPRQAPNAVEVAKGKAAYKLSWDGTWGSNHAAASGALLMTTCKPRCQSKEVKVMVLAEQTVDCDGSTQYAQLVIVPNKHKAKKITVPNSDPSCRS